MTITDDELNQRRLKLWFFRDLSDEQRLALFRIMMHEVPADQLRTQAAQSAAFAHIVESLRQSSPPDGQTARAWLVETMIGNEPWWWAVGLPNEENWTRDSLLALRFARKVDAESFINDMGWTEVVATEHEWSDRIPTPSSETKAPGEEH